MLRRELVEGARGRVCMPAGAPVKLAWAFGCDVIGWWDCTVFRAGKG